MSEEKQLPPAVEAFRQRVTCPRCGAERARLEVLVKAARIAPMLWAVGGICLRQGCGAAGFGFIVRVQGDEAEISSAVPPDEASVPSQPTPLPEWLNRLPKDSA